MALNFTKYKMECESSSVYNSYKSRIDCYNCPVCSGGNCDGGSYSRCVECMNS